MRLAVVNLTSGGLSGGYLKYLRSLVPLLETHFGISSLSVFVPDRVSTNIPGVSAPVRSFDPGNSRASRQKLRTLVLETRPDVVFIPTSRWISFGVPTAVMLRNMEPLAVPFGGNSLIDSAKNIARRLATRRACKSADGVIAVSRYVEDWLSDHWHLDRTTMRVIYHGVERAADGERIPPAAIAAQETGPFVFTAGSIRPARGNEDLIEAFSALPSIHARMKLVIAGGVDKGAEHYKRKMVRLTERLNVSDRILWLGPVAPAEMAWCFANASLVVTTSRAEACPNTVLEAMARGALIVSGNNPPMPEFLQESAFYYEPGNPASLAEQLASALVAAPDVAGRMREEAARRASEFTWKRTADETVSFLRTLHASAVAAGSRA
jgi:glycosyltransferase involved in cell wall biosynthesis